MNVLKRMPGTLIGLVVGLASLGSWGYLSRAPAVPPVPEEEKALALTRSPIVGVGPEFPIAPEIAALRAPPAAAPRAAEARPAPTEETAPAAIVVAAQTAPPPEPTPPRRWVYHPPGAAPRPPTAASWEAAGPPPVRDHFGLTAVAGGDLAGVPPQEDGFGLGDLRPR